MIVQLSAYSARELQLLNLSSLTMALQNDPNLGLIVQIHQKYCNLSLFYRMFFFFSKIVKAMFMRCFYQYAAFITGEIDCTPGSLSDVSLIDNKWK